MAQGRRAPEPERLIWHRCLSCDKLLRDRWLCPACKERAALMETGSLDSAAIALPRRGRGR